MFRNYSGPIPGSVTDEISILQDITASNILYCEKEKTFYLIDSENISNIPISIRFAKFRAELYLILTLQQILCSLANSKLILVAYLRNLYIPKNWLSVNNFSLTEKRFYLYLENYLQNSIGKVIQKTNYQPLLKYNDDEFKSRINNDFVSIGWTKETVDELRRIRSSKFYKLWHLYSGIKKILMNKLNLIFVFLFFTDTHESVTKSGLDIYLSEML